MGVEPSQQQSRRVRHIVISGTSFWNPGDDFVRDGVVRVLQAVFPGEQLNFLFYNFNADFLPHSRLRGIANQVSAGDLEQLRDHVDAVVIAGLSAGEEIKDLYRWVIASGLLDRVFLIGAGYESGYAAQHVAEEPEATIFRHARVVIGRTPRVAPFIEQSRIPYHHLNCPAILSVERVKEIPADRRIGKIGFSLQLPHEIGVVNHACDESMYRLGLELLTGLARHLPVEFLAHHKSEYFHFLELFRKQGIDIPVLFSSFYRDLFAIYPRYDLVVTTRLHASLFANGFGIPGIILNDTDRHTQTLEGFPHSVWVRDRKGFEDAFVKIADLNLREVAADAEKFKQDLLQRYVEILRPVFGTGGTGTEIPLPSDDGRMRAAAVLSAGAAAREVKERVLAVLDRLEADHYLLRNRERYRAAIETGQDWCDSISVLNWFAREFRPRTYLEVGVRRGRSLAQVLTQSPQTRAWGFDLWIPDYGSRPEAGIEVRNPGPEFVRQELARLGVTANPTLVAGDSAETLPRFFAAVDAPAEIDLIYVDGDHGYEGAKRDLDIAFAHLAPAGMLVFDDIAHPSHPELSGLWNEYRDRHPDFLFMEDMSGTGTGVAIRPPFARFLHSGNVASVPLDEHYAFDSERSEQKLVRRVVGPGMTVLDVGANIGKYSRLFSVLTGPAGRVVAFEASPSTASALTEDLRRAGCGNVSVVTAAVYSKGGTVTLNEFPQAYSSWNSIGMPRMEDPRNPERLVPIERSVEIPAVTLDEYCAAQGIAHIDYLKLDVEGVEIEALKGARRLLAAKAIDWVQFEISRKMLEGAGTTARAVFDFLIEAGYEAHRIAPNGAIGRRVTDSTAFYENYIAFPKSAAELAGHPLGRLPVHFFTIVLNGEPFIRHHLEVMRRLPFRWHWHIIEGVADLKHDTAWSVSNGGRITDALHDNGLSNDGTSRYLEEIERLHPDRITVYRKPPGQFWDGKLEMVSAPLEYLDQECLLWQIDADELWQYEQLVDGYLMFLRQPEKTAAFYWCHYFVGPDLVTMTRDTYGNHQDYEWLRTWRFKPGYRWLAHEPPRLCAPDGAGGWKDLAAINPFRHAETEASGMVFQHFAYAIPAQLRFKEDYYGYRDALGKWQRLQQVGHYPVALRDYFSWVSDGTMIDRAATAGIQPVARIHVGGAWRFAPDEATGDDPQRIVWVRTDAIGDNLLASSMLAPLRSHWPQAQLTVVCQEHIGELYEHCPHVDCVLTFNKQRLTSDAAYRNDVCTQLGAIGADLVLNGVFSREPITDFVALACRGGRSIAFEGDNGNMDEATRRAHNAGYTHLVPNGPERLPELTRHRLFLAAIGIECDALQPQVWTTPDDAAHAERFFADRGMDPRRTIAVFPGAQHAERHYDRYGAALDLLPGFNAVVLGSAADVALAEEIVQRDPGRYCNLAGRTSLRQMAEIVRRCCAFLGSESAGAHTACAVGTANVVLLGGGHFGRFMPYSPLTIAAALPLDCFGCNWACRHERVCCVLDVSPATLARGVRLALEQPRALTTVLLEPAPSRGVCKKAQRADVRRWLAGVEYEVIDAPADRQAGAAPPADRPVPPNGVVANG
jgi:FkbM family methyltransferase